MGVWHILRIKCPECKKYGYSADRRNLENDICYNCGYQFKGSNMKAESFKKINQRGGVYEVSG